MKTTIKTLIIPTLCTLFVCDLSGQTNTNTNDQDQKKHVRIKIIDDKNGNKKIIDTIIDINNISDLKALGIELPELPEDLNEPRKPGDPATQKKIRKIVMSGNGPGTDTVIVREGPCGDLDTEMKYLEKDLREMGIELKENSTKVIVIRDEKKDGNKGDEKAVKKVFIKKIMINEVSEQERKTQGTNLSGDNKLNVEHLDFFPNPNNGKFNLTFNLKEKGTTTVSIFSTDGKKVYEEVLSDFSGDYNKTIDLSGSPNGIYFLNVQQGKNNMVKKVVIQ